MLTLPILGALFACGGEQTEAGCPYTVDTLADSTWVMWEAQGDKSEIENPMARMRFFTEDGKTRVKYTAKSLGDVYTYDCVKQGADDRPELACAEEPRIAGFCKALMAYESHTCTPEKLRELGVEATDEEIAKAIDEAGKEYEKYKDDARWSLANNNLGNKLQGLLFVRVNDKRCNLSVDDMYRTVYDGKKVEDYNPVGKNPFVEAKGKDYLFEHCADGRSLADLDSEERPEAKDIPQQRMHEAGKPIWYHYFGEKGVKAEDGCTYSYDSYAQWLPVEKGKGAPVADGSVDWKASATFAAEDLITVAPGRKGAVFHQVRYQDCGGKKEQIDVVCNVGLVR